MEEQSLTIAKEIINEAYRSKSALRIVGGNSKSFYGNDLTELPMLPTNDFDGIVQYEPGELVLQVGAGTKLLEVINTLEGEGQILACDPPVYDGNATVGGAIAAGISGSRRPYSGSVRDFILGVDIIDGKAQHMSFGGQVMKNVAGYDVSRLLTASMGCLGLITEVSLKVLPKPALEKTQCIEIERSSAHNLMCEMRFDNALLSASAYFNGQLYVRFSGMENSVINASQKFGGESLDNNIWHEIDNLHLFDRKKDLWRASLSPGSTLFLKDATLVDWGGGQRWIEASTIDADLKAEPTIDLRNILTESGEAGHLTLVRLGRESTSHDRFQPLRPHLLNLHKGLKAEFDPASILNPHKMYKQF
ncbi:MAG: glycolate oxidase FAD binding subunit [Flavobacterium sp.]|jgi:glycolate oxidase FAD binding subunit